MVWNGAEWKGKKGTEPQDNETVKQKTKQSWEISIVYQFSERHSNNGIPIIGFIELHNEQCDHEENSKRRYWERPSKSIAILGKGIVFKSQASPRMVQPLTFGTFGTIGMLEEYCYHVRG